ncbi:hypothetical protein Tco_1337358 [Tanacetum coccineum]
MTPRSCLRWKPTGRIFNIVGLRWVSSGKIFASSTTKVDSEPSHGSNTDITNLHECIQNLDSSAGTSINVQEEQTLDLSAGTPLNLKKERIKAWIKENVISRRPRIVGQILKDYALSSVLTSTADVPAIYIQLVWMMVKQVLNANDIIRFMVEKENIIYTLDMFRTALKLPTETAKKPFIPPTDFPYIKEFLKIIGYQGPM